VRGENDGLEWRSYARRKAQHRLCRIKDLRVNGPDLMNAPVSIVRTAVAALVGGAWGGAVVGLAEAGLITATAGAGEEYWLFPYAVASYGLFGMLAGFGYFVLVLAAAAVSRSTRRHALGAAAAVAFFVLGVAVTRYHVVQRVFHEELAALSPAGVAVHLGVAVAVGACALMMLYAGRALEQQSRGQWFGAAGFILCLAATSAAVVVASPRPAPPAVTRATGAAAAGHPSIILIIADTLRADALGTYGAGSDASPALDRFARQAVRFANAFSQSTWTRPSIATILTSLYPSVHGGVHKMDPLSDQVTTLAEALRANGYWTAAFVSNINVAPIFNFQQGFDEYTYLEPDFYFGATDSATRLAIYKGLRVLRERLFRGHIYFQHYYQDAEVVNAAALQWLEQRPPKPFFLLIHYMDPHDPYFEIPYNGRGVARVTNPNPPAQRRDELRTLYAEDVAYLDHHLDILIARLQALGLYEDSVIAVTADHGEEFQDHGGWWHGTTLYEEQVRVPLIVKRAHEPRAGLIESRIARTLDVAPTLVVAAGFAPPAAFSGRDLFSAAGSGDEPLFAEEDFEGNVLSSLRVGPWKIITANPDNPRGLQPVELYNLSQDPGEGRNLAAAEPQRVQAMLRLLAQERAQITAGNRSVGLPSSNHASDHRS
jgi:arylsulfatase A-like enzyme